MKRFVTYLYEYERGAKARSTGFIRVDIRGGLVNMEICIRKFFRSGEVGTVYGLVWTDGLKGIELGNIKVFSGQGDLRLQLSEKHLQDTDFSIDDLAGVGIRFQNQSYIASCWEDAYAESIGRGAFVEWQKEDSTGTEVAGQKKAHEETTAEEKNTTDKITENICREDTTEKTIDIEPQYGTVQKPEWKGASTEQLRKTPPASSRIAPRLSEEIQAACMETENIPVEKIEAASITLESDQVEELEGYHLPEKQYIYRKIDLTHMREVPMQDRHYSSNAFLIHGFWNYGYLILKTEMEGDKKKASLGVPGVYERQEAAMAMAFGFPKFETFPEEMIDEMFLTNRKFSPEEIEQNQPPKEKILGCWFVELHT